MDVVIVDYGMGNLFSLQRVIRHLGGRPLVCDDPAAIAGAERLILPGVGSFADGMANLKAKGLDRAIVDFVAADRPLLGICLGMQLLLTEGEEDGLHGGLNLVPGRVVKFQPSLPEGERYKIPHVGWNRIFPPDPAKGDPQGWKGSFLEDCDPGDFVYFVHSYMAVPRQRADILAETSYGRDRFCSVLRRGKMIGCQFHPEVSACKGLDILKRFLTMI